jgi:hypothetical protein
MVKTIFESDASLRNYRQKTKENYMGSIPACARQLVSSCQVLSGRTPSSTRGFYVSTN